LRIIDISNPSSPYEVAYYDTPGNPYVVYVSGNYAYVTDSWEGLRIIDISNPSAPYEAGHYNTAGDALGIYVGGTYAYVADGDYGLRIINIGNPSSPYEKGHYDTPGSARRVYVSGNYAYVATDYYGLRIINVSNPSASVEVGYFVPLGYAIGFHVSGNYAYVAAGSSGLRIIDISNPSAPYKVGYSDRHYASDVYVSGNYAYVADGGDLWIIDISKPSAPVDVGYSLSPGPILGLCVTENYAYVAAEYKGLRVIDISSPSTPAEVGYYDTPVASYGVFVSGNYAYVADYYGGMFILRFTGFSDFALDSDGWTTGGAPIVFSIPEFTWEPDYLKMTSRTNTNTFGYWQSAPGAVPVDANFLCRARFRVLTDITEKSIVPQIRLRANSSNLQQYDVLSIESSGDGGASPAVEGTDYDLYFAPPANDADALLAFDLLNFNPDDAAVADLALDSVTIDRFALDSFSTPTMVRNYTFDVTTDGWTTGGAPTVFSPPHYSHSGGALELRTTTHTNTFGFWSSNPADITIEPNRLYKGTFEVRTDVTNPALVPEMWLRFNAGNFQASEIFGITSIGDGANSPGTTNTVYDRLYFLPPASCVGQNLIVSFDILNFNPEDAAEASLFLDRATIEALPVPSTP